jgi:hypothetical protein
MKMGDLAMQIIDGGVLRCVDIIAHDGTLPSTPTTTLYTAPSSIASYASWAKIRNNADVPTNFPRTIDVVIHCVGFARTAKHG